MGSEPETLGTKLRKLREDQCPKVTQTEIANRITAIALRDGRKGCTQTKVSAWECDEREPDLDDLRDYFDALDIPKRDRAALMLRFVGPSKVN